MADTIENLRAELDALRAEFLAFKAEAQPVIDGHRPVGFPNPERWFQSLPPPIDLPG